MTATSRPGRRIACVALLAAIPLTACAAGYQAETSRERTTLTSVSAAKGDLTLRNIFLVGPTSPGENMPLYMAIFNGGTSSDKLMSISSVASGGFIPSNSTRFRRWPDLLQRGRRFRTGAHRNEGPGAGGADRQRDAHLPAGR